MGHGRVRLHCLLCDLDQVVVAPLLHGGARCPQPGRAGPAPDREAAGDREDGHVGARIVGAHQLVARSPSCRGPSPVRSSPRPALAGLPWPAARPVSRPGHRRGGGQPDGLTAEGPPGGQPGAGKVMAPAPGRIARAPHLEAPSAHRVSGCVADGAARHVAAHPAGEGVKDLADQPRPPPVAPQVQPELGIDRSAECRWPRVQCVSGKLTDHRHAVVNRIGLKLEPGCHQPVQTTGSARAGWVPR